MVRAVSSREDERLATFRCNMEFKSDSLGCAQQDFMDKILGVLDIMSLITHAEFRFERLLKIFDWTPNKTMRDGLIFVYNPPESTPNWVLNKEFFETANLLQHATLDDQLLGALRWFRLGIVADTSQEQFQNFWFALELLPQHKKSTNKIHDSCPMCGEPLYCKTCDTYPMHRPYPRQAIESTWNDFAPNELDLFKTISKARNKLMHGVPLEQVEEIAGMPLHQMLDPLARLTWKGLFSKVVANLPEEKRPKNLRIDVANTLVKWDRTAAVNINAFIPLGPNGAPDIELLTGISAEFVSE